MKSIYIFLHLSFAKNDSKHKSNKTAEHVQIATIHFNSTRILLTVDRVTPPSSSSSEFTMAPLSRCSVAPYNITVS